MITEEEIRKHLDGKFVTVTLQGAFGLRKVDPDWVPDYGDLIREYGISREDSRRYGRMAKHHHNPWTDEDDDKLRKLRDQGLILCDIATQLGRGVSGVQKRLQILAHSNHKKPPMRNIRWTDEMRRTVADLRAHDVHWTAIAARFGTSTKSVQHALRSHRRRQRFLAEMAA